MASKLLLENVLGLRFDAFAASWLSHAGPGAAATVVMLLAADIFLPVPSSLLMILSGAAFGVVWGSLLSLIGSIAGEWLGFELVRRYGRRASRHLVGEQELERVGRLFAKHGAAAVAVTRALPIVMETMSVAAGLSSMPRSTFLLASLAGTTPIVIVYAYAGAVSREAGSLIPAMVMLIAVAGAAWFWYRVKIDRPPATAPAASSSEASLD